MISFSYLAIMRFISTNVRLCYHRHTYLAVDGSNEGVIAILKVVTGDNYSVS